MTWTYIRLKHVARVGYGLGQPPDLSESGIAILRATNITHGKITPEGLIFAAKENLPLDRAPLLSEGEILVVRSGAYTGDSALVTGTWAGSAPGYDLRVSPMSAEPRYLAYCMLSTVTLDQVDLAKNRAAQPHLNAEDLGDVTISVPSFDEQRRIADFLDAETAQIDQLISLQRTVRDWVKARTVAQLDLMVDELSAVYGSVPFRRMIRSIEQGSSPQCDSFSAWPDRWGVLKVSAVKDGVFLEDENKQLPPETPPEPRYEIKSGDLLITRANTPQLVGATAVAHEPRRKLMLCDKIFRVATTRNLLPDFLVLVSLGTRIRDMCAEASHGASQSMANLKTGEIKQWPIPAAPISVQQTTVKKFSSAREHAGALTCAINDQLALLAERRQALITAAVTGQIDVSTAGRGISG